MYVLNAISIYLVKANLYCKKIYIYIFILINLFKFTPQIFIFIY